MGSTLKVNKVAIMDVERRELLTHNGRPILFENRMNAAICVKGLVETHGRDFWPVTFGYEDHGVSHIEAYSDYESGKTKKAIFLSV